MSKKTTENKLITQYGLTVKTSSIEDKDGKTIDKKEYGLHEKYWKIMPTNLKLWIVMNKVTIYTGDEDFLVPVTIYKFLEMKNYDFLEKYKIIFKDIEDEATKDRIDFSSRSGVSRLFTDEAEYNEIKKDIEKIKKEARGTNLNWDDEPKKQNKIN